MDLLYHRYVVRTRIFLLWVFLKFTSGEGVWMSSDEHYLKQELYNLVKTDPAIFDFLQEGSLDGLWYWDLENPEHEWMSPRFWQVLGYDPDGRLHDPASWQDIINQDDLQTALDNFRYHCADASHPYDQIVRYRHKAGHTVTIRCRGIAIRDEAGQAIRMLGAHNDITDLIDAKEAERARERAEAANLSKTVFVGNISHEIRTPLNSILVNADALRATDLTPMQSEILEDMFLAGEQLQGLLSDLIDISRIETGEISMEFQALSPREVMEDVASTFSGSAREKGLGLQVRTVDGAVPAVYGSIQRIRQVLINLLSNAIKFTDTGHVALVCDARATGDEDDVDLSFRITDTGPGVPDEIKDMIFDRFHRSDTDLDLKVSGVGIGLSISKALCELHGGSLAVENGIGGGAVFTARFRVRRADASTKNDALLPEAEGMPSPAALHPGMRVFVAEDVLLNRRSLKHLLQPFGTELIFATNGIQALELMKTVAFDVALIDLRMPGMSGSDVVIAYREFEAAEGIARRPVIACSAHVLSDEKAEYRTRGFDDFLSKPLKRSDLIDAITRVR